MKIRHSRMLALLLMLSVSFSLSSVAEEELTTRSFIEQAAVKSLTVIKSAENALEFTDSQTISAYAHKMMSEYENVHSKIVELADAKDIDIASKANSEEALEIALEDKNAFDVAYARNQVAVHQHSLSLFQRAVKSDDYETRTLAISTLPYIQQHLQMAEQLYAATAESKTNIYQDRENKVDYSDDDEPHRTPSTDKSTP